MAQEGKQAVPTMLATQMACSVSALVYVSLQLKDLEDPLISPLGLRHECTS
jgi:hypothetical protein